MRGHPKDCLAAIFCMAAALLVSCGGGGGGGGGGGQPAGGGPPGDPAPVKVHGLNFSPYLDGQAPDLGTQISEAQLRARLEIVAPYTRWVRSYGCDDGLERFAGIARGMGFKTAVGAWLGPSPSANQTQLDNLISVARAGDADLLIVGNEVLLRGDLSETDLLDAIRRVRQEAPGIPVTYADVYGILLSHPDILDAVDVVFVNYYPYWEGIDLESAVPTIHGWHPLMVDAAGAKRVVVSETGWPSDGDPVGRAVPSPENAAAFFLNFVSWAKAEGVDYFYFEAFDENWKAAHEGPPGAHWGVWDADGSLKPGMEGVFEGRTVPDHWSVVGIPGGPGDPAIEFTYVPPRGSHDDLQGRVLHVSPFDYRVACYIYVTGWWTKPNWTQQLTTIQIDGSWIADITTGGVDETAGRIAAFLVPKDYDPPSMSGGSSLPQELFDNALAYVVVDR